MEGAPLSAACSERSRGGAQITSCDSIERREVLRQTATTFVLLQLRHPRCSCEQSVFIIKLRVAQLPLVASCPPLLLNRHSQYYCKPMQANYYYR